MVSYMYCPQCNKPVSPQMEHCPHCGATLSKPPSPPREEAPPWASPQQADVRNPKQWSTKAIVGLCCGIVGLMCCPVIGQVAGIILSVLAMNEGDERHGKISLWVSIGSLTLVVLFWIAYYVVFISAMMAHEPW